MRIKFRGKCRISGEWEYGNHYGTGRESLELFWMDVADGLIIPKTVGQSIGLKDKDFWQDDVLESADKLRKYVIKRNDKKGQWYLHGIGKAWCVNGDKINWDEYTKIGNVHDNPEIC